jgi:Niemann-Pick C2 protein
MDMDTNACLYTQCPMVAQVERSWLYNLYVSENYPKSSYTVKLKFWDGEPEAKSDDECCFKFDMKIV